MRPEIPNIELTDEDVGAITTLSEEELALVPYDKRKWQCCIEGCHRYTNVKYYGSDAPVYWRKQWEDLTEKIFFCAMHWKQYKASGGKLDQFTLKPGSGIDHLI